MKTNERIKELAQRIAAMPKEQREEMAAKLPVIVTIEGHPLSLRNTMLIHLQAGDGFTPTVVGGFRQWLKQGRCVAKGQRGLGILYPCKPKQRGDVEVAEAGEDGGERRRIFFRSGTVFDVSQTMELAAREFAVVDGGEAE